jgi:hypothetical protein
VQYILGPLEMADICKHSIKDYNILKNFSEKEIKMFMHFKHEHLTEDISL